MRAIVKLLFLNSFILLSASCISELEDMENADNIERVSAQMHAKSTARVRSVETKTFSRLPNPYSLANMQRVYDDCGVDVELEPTDVYIKFMPSDSTQLRRLYDCGFELFDHPLDIELEAGDVYYNDSIPKGTLTYLYTTVKPNVMLESFGVPYEHLEDCYIPKDGEVIECEDPQTKAPVYVDVEIAAFSNLGYVLENSGRTSMANPQGNIKVRDNTAAMDVPVKGVKVRCHRFVKWASVYTDTFGNYVIDKKFRYKPYYSIIFTNEKGVDIWGSYGPIAKASYNMGSDYNIGHSEIIDETNNAWEWAAINNAAYEYYEISKNDSIASPPSGLKIWSWKFTEVSLAPMLDKMMESAKESCAQSFFSNV